MIAHRLAMTALAIACGAASCAAVTRTSGHMVVLADNPSQLLFNDAMRWSRKHHLETGGCFSVFTVQGDKIVITDVVERVQWRRPLKVMLDCPPKAGLWHTHHEKASRNTVGCNMDDAMDRWLGDYSHVALVVICGEGRDSVIFYTSAPADSLIANRKRWASRFIPPDTDTYDCAHESPASLNRPRIACYP